VKTTTKGIIVVAACIAFIILFGVFSRFVPVVFVILGVGIYLIDRKREEEEVQVFRYNPHKVLPVLQTINQ
jgi:uncharacterized membrane protein